MISKMKTLTGMILALKYFEPQDPKMTVVRQATDFYQEKLSFMKTDRLYFADILKRQPDVPLMCLGFKVLENLEDIVINIDTVGAVNFKF